MAIFSNEYVLGGLIVGVLIAGGTAWAKTRNWFSESKDKES